MLDLNQLSTEDLRKLSLEKIETGIRKGCATPLALIAQKILHERAGCPFQNSYTWKRDHTVIKRF